MTVYVFGHKNPDSDSIVSAIAGAELLRARGIDAIACKQGDINPESKFILEKFGLEIPETITSVEGKTVALIDTTYPEQLPEDIDKATIIFIADHHKLGGLKTAMPLEFYGQPVGCTATILANIFKLEGKKIPANIAGAMMCAIFSDTVLFKSPTTTDWDKKAVEELAKIADVKKPFDLGLEMLKIKSSIENDSAIDLIKRDFKDFHICGNKRLGIGQIELIDGSMADSKKPAILEEMKKLYNEGNYDLIILLITDIMKEGSEMLVVSDDIPAIEKAFGVKIENNSVWIDGMMSRKKQVIPVLETKLS